MASACASIEAGRFGVSSLEITGNRAVAQAAIAECAITREREAFTLSIGLSQPECGVPPFDSSPVRLRLWRWPWTEWPSFNRAVFEWGRGHYPAWAFVPSVLVSSLVGAFAVRSFSGWASRFVDTGGGGSTRKHQLVGQWGTVASAQLDGRFGEVRVTDGRGNELLVHGRLDGALPALPRGAKVVLVDYEAQDGLFRVSLPAGPDHEVEQ
jgi:hypothetical protein